MTGAGSVSYTHLDQLGYLAGGFAGDDELAVLVGVGVLAAQGQAVAVDSDQGEHAVLGLEFDTGVYRFLIGLGHGVQRLVDHRF